jgi:hypothetical protein
MADSHGRWARGASAALALCRSRFRLSARLATVAIAVALLVGSASAQVSPRRIEDSPSAPPASSLVRPNAWNIDGVVNAIAQSGNTIYFGGEFSILDKHPGSGVPFDPITGAISTSFPAVGGSVYAAADDGAGGWYIGGDFSIVGGLPRNRLAHILADGTVTPWNPGADYWVYAIAVEGDVVYVGGQFRSVGGQARNGLAAVDGRTGAVLPWDPQLVDYPTVGALTISDHMLYIGGWFLSILGQPRSCIASVDARTGALTDWNPNANGYVSCLAVRGGLVYAGGDFYTMGGVERRFLAAVDAHTGALTPWNPTVTPEWNPSYGSDVVSAISVTDSAVYVGGYFIGAGGKPRNCAAALDPKTGAALPWDPQLIDFYGVPSSVFAIAACGPNVLLGGWIYSAGGQTCFDFIVTDAVTGNLRRWNLFAWPAIVAIVPARDRVFVGGTFTSFEETRYGLASVDATTGALDGRNYGFVGTRVNALAVRDSFLYVGGKFDLVAGGGGSGLAEINTRTRMATRFVGSTNGEVHSLLATDSRLYVGGAFTVLYGLPFAFPAPPRNGLARTNWTPAPREACFRRGTRRPTERSMLWRWTTRRSSSADDSTRWAGNPAPRSPRSTPRPGSRLRGIRRPTAP